MAVAAPTFTGFRREAIQFLVGLAGAIESRRLISSLLDRIAIKGMPTPNLNVTGESSRKLSIEARKSGLSSIKRMPRAMRRC